MSSGVTIKLATAIIPVLQGLKWRDQCPCFGMGRDIPSLTKLQALQMTCNLNTPALYIYKMDADPINPPLTGKSVTQV